MPHLSLRISSLIIDQHRGLKMVGLGAEFFSGRLAHSHTLFEGLMVFFDFSPSLTLINRRELGLLQVRVAADQM